MIKIENNYKINEFIFKGIGEFIDAVSTGIYRYIINDNLIFLFLLLLILIYWFLVRRYNKLNLIRKSFINLIAHILLSYVFGSLVKITNLDTINKLLDIYWSIGAFVVYIVIIIFIKETVTYLKSYKKIVKSSQKTYYVIGLTYIFTAAALVNQIPLLNNLILISSFVFGWIILQLFSYENKSKYLDQADDESDNAINSFEKLLPTRKEECTNIYEMLKRNSYNEPFALLLNGDWGTGKTSLTNGLSEKLRADNNHIIFIQPMILDTSEKLMEYSFRQLEALLNSNGIFTGKDSPFKNYFNIIFQTINTLNLKQVIKLDMLLENLDSKEDSDFRNNKKSLEIDIQKLLSMRKGNNKDNAKIYIIIDDFDRVEKETFKSTLIFIKEIVNFNGIDIIFLLNEERLYINKIVPRDYLDKFVNKKFQLSKIEYKEILNHFIKSIDNIKLEKEFTIVICQEIKKNIVELVTDLITDTAKPLTDIENEINTLKNKMDDSKDNDKQQEKLNNSKVEVEENFKKLMDGVSNVRKTKKIIREIKELLIIIDQQVLRNDIVEYNLRKVVQIQKIIIRVAIFKIIFTECVDKLIQQEETFYDVMGSIKYFNNKNYLLSSFFSNIFNVKEVQMYILNDLFNAIILNYSFKSLDVDKQTTTQIILDNLDNSEKPLTIDTMQELHNFLEVMRFSSPNGNNETINKRLTKLVRHIINLYEDKKLSFINLFELLGKPQRNQLLQNETYLLEIYKLLDKGVHFKNKNDRSRCINYIKEVKYIFDFESRQDIFMILVSLNLQDLVSIESLKVEFDNNRGFEKVVNMIKKYSNEDNTDISSITFLKQWVDKSVENISSENKFITEAIKLCEKSIRVFIGIYELIEMIIGKLEITQVEPAEFFSEDTYYVTIEKLILDIERFHDFICKQNNEMNLNYLITFNRLLAFMEQYSQEIILKNEIMDKINNLYNTISIDKDEKNWEWTWCNFRLGQIIANQEHLGEKEQLSE